MSPTFLLQRQGRDVITLEHASELSVQTHGSLYGFSICITKADDSRFGHVKTILLISIVLFPKCFIITKSGIHTIELTNFVY